VSIMKEDIVFDPCQPFEFPCFYLAVLIDLAQLEGT
jgi:hypothetical protein